MRFNFKDLGVGITILSLDGNICSLSLELNDIFIFLDDVYVNDLCKYQLINTNNVNVELGKRYYSLNNSDSYVDNPFCLVRSHDDSGSIRYYLKLVYTSHSLKNRVDTLTGFGVVYENFKFKKKDYYRFIDSTISGFHPKRGSYSDGVNFVGI